MLHISLLVMNRFNKTEFAFFFISLMWFLLPRDLANQNLFLFIAAVFCRVAAVKRLPVHYHSAEYNFWSFGIIELIFSHLKIEFR